MENIVKCRRVYRTAITKNAQQLEQIMDDREPDLQEIEAQWTVLKDKMKTLKEQDATIQDLLLQSEYKEGDLTQELNNCETYNVRFVKLTIACNNLLQKTPESVRVSQNSFEDYRQKKHKLPVIEFKKFSGDVKEWLAFWAQFKKIHLDPNLDEEDKFQYLLQATVQGSRARELVESFPPTQVNYQKAVDSLKSRFGQDDMLVEVYVRELLKIVLNNALFGNAKVPLDTLYDRIETKLRALDTLGVTTDKCAAMLYPLVESCLPEDILRVWQRSRDFTSSETSILKNRLSGLMNFLKSEVENEARISMAAEGFGLCSSDSVSTNKAKRKAPIGSSIPTTMHLFNGTINCIFCGKAHRSEDCFKARKLSLDEKRKIMYDQKVCFRCLKIGHQSRKCRERISCVVCNGQHYTLLCPTIPVNQTEDKNVNKSSVEPINDTALSNFTNTQVFLQTLRVKVLNEGSEREVRAVIDTGSQRSYILNDLAENLRYRVKSTEEITHALFGGVASERQQHSCYDIRLAKLDGSYRCRFEALSQKRICTTLPHITNGEWTQELKARNIEIADKLPGPIEVLIGADIAGKLFTGKNLLLNSGLVAVHTFLGWTVMGKVPCHNVSKSTTMTVAALLAQDILPITDPLERQSRQQLEEAAQQHFEETVTVADDGRKILQACEGGTLPFSEKIIRKLQDSFYVDNCVTSVNDTEKLNELIHQVSESLKLAAFDLRGWESTQHNSQGESLKTLVLGLTWNRAADTMSVSEGQKISALPEIITKRYILSETQQIFDPIGFTCPATLRPKLMLHELWTKKGGWWERMVRLVKQLLKRVFGTSSLSYEELHTVLCDCESVINSRPLTYLSNDPADSAPLSPKNFLRDNFEDGVDDCDQVEREDLQRRVQYRQQISKHLRQRFRSEYLGRLRQIHGRKSPRAISVGDVMLIGDDNRKRLDWPLGRVVQVFPGKDGEIRLAKLRTASGHQLLRPIQRLYPLECNEDIHSPSGPTTSKAIDVTVEKKKKRSSQNIPKIASDSDSESEIMACQSERITSRGRVIKAPIRYWIKILLIINLHSK